MDMSCYTNDIQRFFYHRRALKVTAKQLRTASSQTTKYQPNLTQRRTRAYSNTGGS